MKKGLGVFLGAALALGMVSLMPVHADVKEAKVDVVKESASVLYSGSCGTSANYVFYSDGSLVISGSGVMDDYDNQKETFAPWDSYKGSIKKIEIESGVTSIGKYAFANCTSLESVKVPNNVTVIDDNAFEGCTSLATVSYPKELTVIGSDTLNNTAFYNNSENWTSGCLYLGNALIKVVDTENIKCDVKIGTAIIARRALENCTTLQTLILPNTLHYIGHYAFYNCSNLLTITLPNSLIYIESDVAKGDSKLSRVYYVGNKAEWEAINEKCDNYYQNFDLVYRDVTFYGQGNCGDDLKYKIEPSGRLVVSGTGAMTDYFTNTGVPWYIISSNILEISIGENVTTVGNNSFYNCVNVENIYLSDDLEKIGASAFRNCKGVKSVVIPEGVKNVAAYAFLGCVELKWVYIPTTLEKVGAKGLVGGGNLKTVRYGGTESALSQVTGVEYIGDSNTTIKYKCSIIDTPKVVLIAGENSIKATWTAVTGATKYRVFTYDGSFHTAGDTTGTSYSITGLASQTKVGILVLAYDGAKWTAYEDDDIVYATTTGDIFSGNGGVDKPVVTLTAGDGKITAKWGAVTGAAYYRVFTYDNSFHKIKDTTLTSCTITGLANGTKIGVVVLANVNGRWTSYTNDDIKYATPCASTSNPTVTLAAGDSQITATWTAVSGATKYRAFTYLNGSFKKVADTTNTYCSITGLTNGTKIGVVVLAYVNGKWTSYTNDDIKYATPAKTSKPTLVLTTSSKSILAQWGAVTGATKYRVFTYDGAFHKIGDTTATKYSITGLTNGKQMGVIVLAYVNGKWTSYTNDDIKYATPTA